MNATAIYGAVYPASVLFPDGSVHTRCKVYATDAGLFVYYAVPGDGYTPDWSSPIDYLNTARTPTGYRARLGWEVATDAGLVIVTADGGCGCGWPLKRWTPLFARARRQWPASV